MPVSKKAIAERNKTFKALAKIHPNAWTELNYKNPLELLVAVMLSAQATDKLVNIVTKNLFKKYKNAKDYAKASVDKLDNAITRVNFHTNKAKSINAMAKMLLEKHKGRVPQSMEELVALPGVGRKTASAVLGHAFGKAQGIVVDTHVIRLSQRLGWTKNSDPVKIEKDLVKLFPKKDWVKLADTLVLHGRYICKARNPQCQNCPYEPFCPSQRNVKN